jgi:chloramphenicol 3-O phosphotransferase
MNWIVASVPAVIAEIGEGRSHVELDLIHTFGPYDLEADATAGLSAALAESVLEAWRKRTAPHAMQPRPPAK